MQSAPFPFEPADQSNKWWFFRSTVLGNISQSMKRRLFSPKPPSASLKLTLSAPKLSDSSGQHEYRQHHACHSERQRRIFWVEPPSEILRRLSAPQNDSERRIAQFRRQSVGVSFSYENLLFLLGFLYVHL